MIHSREPTGGGSFYRGLVWLTGLTFLQKATYLVLLPLYLRFLTPEEVGILMIVIVAAGLMSVPANLRLDAAMRTFYFDYSDDEHRLSEYLAQLFSVSLYLIAASMLLLFLAGPALFELGFDHEELVFYPNGALALAAACLNLTISPYLVYLRNRQALSTLAILQVSMIAANMILQITLVGLLDMGVPGALGGSILAAAGGLAYVMTKHKGILTLRLDAELLRPSFLFSIPLIGFSFLYLLESRLDRFFIERNYPLDVVGAYAVITGVLGLVTAFSNALDNALRPALYQALQQRAPSMEIIDGFQRVYVAVMLLFIAGAVLLGSSIGLLTDSTAFLDMRQWLPLGATAFVPLVYARFCSLVFVFYKYSSSLTLQALLRVTLMFLLLSILVPRFGVPGALWSILLSQLLSAFMLRLQLVKFCPVRVVDGNAAMQAAVAVIGFWLPTLLLSEGSFVMYGAIQFTLIAVGLMLLNFDLLVRLIRSLCADRASRSR